MTEKGYKSVMKNFSGNHFEVGLQMGGYYKAVGASFSPVTEASLLDKQLKFYERYAPEIIDELRGVAQESAVLFDRVAHAFLVGEILFLRNRRERSCSIGGFIDATGRAWVARNYDWVPAAGKTCQAWKFYFPDKKVVAISDMGIGDARGLDRKYQIFRNEDAINSDGLYIGLTFAHRWVDGIGLTSFDAITLSAWRCKSVGEVVNLFETLPLSAPKNFFVADAAGKMAVIHHGADKFDVRYPDKQGLLVLTNHYVGRLEPDDQVRAIHPHHTTFNRYERLLTDMQKLRTSQETGFEKLDSMMTAPNTPVCQCIMVPNSTNQVFMETVWTLLLDLKQKHYRLINNPRSQDRRVTNFSL